MFPHRNIHKYMWISPDGKALNQIDHILIDMRWHSTILDVRSFKRVDCVSGHYLVVTNVTESFAVKKMKQQRRLMGKDLISEAT
jgi:hypothetical protein